ncbi:hypothetical protein AX17_001032 [Amanita inopinata Kibby_2008]|nr:hypothetical protein AX17_001032 [Amanita inopinata Kibby_2008]
MLAAAARPLQITRNRNLLYAAITLSVAPKVTYWVAVLTSRRKEAVLGPALTHVTVLGPLAFILVTFLVHRDTVPSDAGQRPRIPPLHRLLVTITTWWIVLQVFRRMWSRLAFLRRVSDSQIYLNLAFLAYGGWILTYPSPAMQQRLKKGACFPNKAHGVKLLTFVCFATFWWLSQSNFESPILHHPLPEPYTRPDYPLRVQSAVQSVTGLITVADALPHATRPGESNVHSLRYLRASHSILGGVWMYDRVHILGGEQPITDSYGTYLGDSIYAAFVLQDAVRLVNNTERGKAELLKEGLIIGLGTGISATAFNRHEIATTIVEIDPAVYEAARRYFGLPDPGPGRVFLEDARAWVSNKRAIAESTGDSSLFDFVVHDCFSGGGIPEHIYTLEFWNDLKTLLEPEGIIAVNYAGLFKSESSRFILHTLINVFGQCRAFHDQSDANDLPAERYESSFVNIVIFCTRSASALTFRKARKSDYLGSPLRRQVLTTLYDREVNITSVLEGTDSSRYILTDKHNPLGKLQEAQGHHHWTLMREVLPDVHWETY